MKWKSGLGRKATYRALVEVFFQAGELTYAYEVCSLLSDTEQMGEFSKIITCIHVRRKLLLITT